MEKNIKNYIIVRKIKEGALLKGIYELEDLAVCYPDGELKIFPSRKNCRDYMEQESFDGTIVKIHLEHSNIDNAIGK